MLADRLGSPVIKRNKKVQEIFQKIDKIAQSHPHISTHYVNKKDYQLLLDNIPESIRARYINKISHNGISIMEAP